MPLVHQRKDATPAELAAQTEMDFLVPFSDRRALLNIAEVAKTFDREKDWVEAMIEEGRLEAERDETREVQRKKITRRSVLLLHAELFSTDPRLFLERLLRCVDALTAKQCEEIIRRATARRAKL